MAIIIKPKKSETASAVPTTSDLAVGEICMNVADQKVYTRKSDNSIVIVASHGLTDLDGSVTTAKLADGAVTTIKIDANAVDGTKIALGSDAAGDVMYYNGTNYIRLAKGTATQVLTMNSGATAPEWAADSTNVSGTSVGGDLTGTVGNASIAANAVDGTHIQLGSDAAGDVMYYDGTNYIRLAKGSNGEVLTLASGVPSWAADSTNVGGTSVGGDVTGTVSNIQIGSNTITATELADNSVGIAEINVTDGTNGQILKTNGSGTLSFIDPGATIQQATAKAVTMAIALG